MTDNADGVTRGDGYAVANVDDLGDGYGFRKIRTALGVSAFGINAVAIPPGFESNFHSHERQEEVYFVHRGTVRFLFDDGSAHEAGPGGCVFVAPHTVRGIRTVGDEDALYVAIGGAEGYVGRDGRAHASLDAPPTESSGAPGAS